MPSVWVMVPDDGAIRVRMCIRCPLQDPVPAASTLLVLYTFAPFAHGKDGLTSTWNLVWAARRRFREATPPCPYKHICARFLGWGAMGAVWAPPPPAPWGAAATIVHDIVSISMVSVLPAGRQLKLGMNDKCRPGYHGVSPNRHGHLAWAQRW